MGGSQEMKVDRIKHVFHNRQMNLSELLPGQEKYIFLFHLQERKNNRIVIYCFGLQSHVSSFRPFILLQLQCFHRNNEDSIQKP